MAVSAAEIRKRKTSMRAAFITLGLAAAGIAWAGDEPAEAPAEEEKVEEAAEVDCSTLEGDEKTKCEEAAKAAEADKPEEEEAEEAAEEEAPAKGGKAKRDSSGNMEAEMDDE